MAIGIMAGLNGQGTIKNERIRVDRSGLIIECNNKSERDEIPTCVLEMNEWREILAQKKVPKSLQ
jgi:hypothetical protein